MSNDRRAFVFDKESVATLESIKTRAHLGSDAEVIRAALTVFDALLQGKQPPDKMIVREGAQRQDR